jgi:hypothetical protein
MKKFMSVALVASCLAAPASLSAQQQPNVGPFESRGECERALKQQRNDFRKNPEKREPAGLAGTKDFNNKEFNQFARDDFECQKQNDGTFMIVFTDAGSI